MTKTSTKVKDPDYIGHEYIVEYGSWIDRETNEPVFQLGCICTNPGQDITHLFRKKKERKRIIKLIYKKVYNEVIHGGRNYFGS